MKGFALKQYLNVRGCAVSGSGFGFGAGKVSRRELSPASHSGRPHPCPPSWLHPHSRPGGIAPRPSPWPWGPAKEEELSSSCVCSD